MNAPSLMPDQVLARTRLWLERAVIGLNLCPFAKSVYAKEQVHFVVYEGVDAAELLDIVRREMHALVDSQPMVRDTTLLIAPLMCPDFWDFHGVVARADRVLRKSGLTGVLQIASFHPAYEFADDAPHDMSHFTNRAPYPILHVLREASVARAVADFSQAQSIFQRNKATLRELGPVGWNALACGPLA